LESGICGQEAAIQIGEGNADSRILKDGSPPFLTLSQSLFRWLWTLSWTVLIVINMSLYLSSVL